MARHHRAIGSWQTSKRSPYFAMSGLWNRPLPPGVPIDADNANIITDMAAAMTASSPTPLGLARLSYSCPEYKVTSTQPLAAVTLTDSGGTPFAQTQSTTNQTLELAWRLGQGVPIPTGAVPAAGNDGHMAIINTDTNEMWHMWKVVDNGDGTWKCQGGGYIPDHTVNPGYYRDQNLAGAAPEPRMFWQWAGTATSLPVNAGLITMAEIAAGEINHVLHCKWPYNASRTVSDLVTTSGSTIATSATANFTATDDTASIKGAAVIPVKTTGQQPVTFRVISSTMIQLSEAATASSAGATVTIWTGPSRYVWPAQRGDGTQDTYTPLGGWFKLRNTVDPTSFTGTNATHTKWKQMVARALQKYGAIITDHQGTGSAIQFRCEVDTTVDDVTLYGVPAWQVLQGFSAAQFEFVDRNWRPSASTPAVA